MIKATELQIGDFVLVDGTPRKVEAITKKKIGYHRKENEPRLYYARLHDVEPIEITEEFLFNHGFKVNRKYKIYEWKERLYGCMGQTLSVTTPRYLQFEPQMKFWGIDNPHTGFEWRGCFEYVHEFQHIVKSCDINFEVKL